MGVHILKNPVFVSALWKAGNLLKDRKRIFLLLGQVIKKLNGAETRNQIAAETKDKIYILGRMLKAFASGQYKAVPWKAIAGITATLLYFVNPADIIPDFIPFTGFVDDFSVLLWMFGAIQNEVSAFLDWENSALQSS